MSPNDNQHDHFLNELLKYHARQEQQVDSLRHLAEKIGGRVSTAIVVACLSAFCIVVVVVFNEMGQLDVEARSIAIACTGAAYLAAVLAIVGLGEADDLTAEVLMLGVFAAAAYVGLILAYFLLRRIGLDWLDWGVVIGVALLFVAGIVYLFRS